MHVAMLLNGISIDACARRWPGISRDSFARCKKKHCGEIATRLRAEELASVESAKYKKALTELTDRESRSLIANVVATRHKLNALSVLADNKGDYRESAKIQSRILQVLETTGRILGSFAADNARVINQSLIVSPDYIRLRSGLMKALAPYPEARSAVARMLAELESVEPVEKAEPKLITAEPIEDAVVTVIDEEENS